MIQDNYNELHAELAALYEIASFKISASLDNIASEAKRKAVHLFSPRYFAVIVGNYTTGRVITSWGMTNARKIRKHFSVKRKTHYSYSSNNSFHVLFDLAFIPRDKEKRLLHLFSLHLQRPVENALYIQRKEESARKHRDSKHNYLELIHSLHEAIFILDTNGKIIEVNHRVHDLCGYSKAQLLGKDITFLADSAEHDFESLKKNVQRAAQGCPEHFNLCGVTREGNLFYADIVCKRGIFFDKRVIIITARDITGQKKISEQVRILAAAIKSVNDCITITDLENRLIFVNEAFCNSYGYTEEESLGRHISFIHSPRTPRNLLQEVVLNTFQDGWQGEIVNKRKDGSEFPVFLSTSVVVDEKGHSLGFIGVATDITRRKQQEEAIKENERRLNTLIQNVPGIVYRCLADLSWTMLFVSEGSRRLIGYEPGDLLHNRRVHYIDLIHPDDRSMVAREIGRALEEHRPFQLTYRIIHAQKNIKWVWEQGRGVYDEQDDRLRFIEGLIIDISYQKKVEEDLVKQRNLLDAIINNAPMAIWLGDSQGNYSLVNEYFKKAVGLGSSKPSITPDELKICMKSDELALKSSEPVVVEETITFRDAHKHTMQIIKTRLNEDIHDNPRILGLGMDITERKKMEEQLKKSEARNRATLAAIPDMLFVFDKDGRCFDFQVGNKGMKKYLMTTPEEVFGIYLADIFPPDLTKKMLEHIHACMESGEMQTFEYDLNIKRQQQFFEARIVKLAENRVLGLVRCVTARKEAERRLSRINECFLSFVPEAGENIKKLTTLAGELLHADYISYSTLQEDNPASFTFWSADKALSFPTEIEGFIHSRLLRKKHNDIMMIQDVQSFCGEKLKDIQKQNVIHSYIGKMITRDGNPIGLLSAYYRDTISTDPELEKIMSILSIAIEIEEGKRHYRELVEAEKERLLVTLHSITEGVIATDINGGIVLMNDVACQLTGWNKEDASGRNVCEVLNLYNDNKEKICENLAQTIIEKGASYNYPQQYFISEGEESWRTVTLSGAPIRSREDIIIGLVFIARDITEQKVIEEEMIKRQKLESIGTLAAGIAHDFNNLLTGLFGSLELAKKHVESRKKLERYLEHALSAYDRAQNLTMQLLTFSKGGHPIKEVHCIRDILKNATNFALSGTNIFYRIDSAEDLWLCTVDNNQIEQAIDNILINARQAMPEGGKVEISAHNLAPGKHSYSFLSPKSPFIRISIRDEGPGIPQQYLKNIFDPFFTLKEEGSGLGLATAHSIIQQHSGYITVESRINEGTEFNIFLPATPEAQRLSAPLDNLDSPGKGTVLVMDDEEMILNVISEMLKELGYETDVCKEGQEAIDKYEVSRKEGRPYDVLILDLTVPGNMGGKEVVEILRKKYPDIITIASTGYSSDPVMRYPEKYGFNGKLPKPYQLQQLHKTLQNILS